MKMNYHSDEWIMAGVQRHYDEVQFFYHPEQIIGVFYTGSANYNADAENSDIDTWAIVIEDNYDANSYRVKTHYLETVNEVVWLCDIRAFVFGIANSDFWYLLPLFTKYKILNPTYEDLYQKIFERKEKYAYSDINNAIKVLIEQMQKHSDYSDSSHKKTLYYFMLLYAGFNIYKYNAPFESLFHNEIYGKELQAIKNGDINYQFGKQLCSTVLDELRTTTFDSSKKSIDSQEILVFSQEIIEDFLRRYQTNEHSDKN